MFRSIRFKLFFIGLLLAAASLRAQSLKKLKEFKVGRVENVSVDRLGNFFLIFNHDIKKYDGDGKMVASFKIDKKPTLIEPWYYPKIFVYDRQRQHYVNYDRNFQNAGDQQLDPSIAIQPTLVCPTSDNKLLVMDAADWSIKKVNPFTNQVMTEFYIDTTDVKPNYVYMREYQNLIFLLDKNSGIIIYNIVGKKINHLKSEANNFGFFGEELYFLQEDKVVFYDLYTEKIRLVQVGTGKFVLVSDELEKDEVKRILVVKENGRASLFEFNGKGSPD